MGYLCLQPKAAPFAHVMYKVASVAGPLYLQPDGELLPLGNAELIAWRLSAHFVGLWGTLL